MLRIIPGGMTDEFFLWRGGQLDFIGQIFFIKYAPV